MIRHELADTLLNLIEGVTPPAAHGLIVTEAELDIPLEVTGGFQLGELVFYSSVPHSRWKAGFLPHTHMGRLRIELVEDPVATDEP